MFKYLNSNIYIMINNVISKDVYHSDITKNEPSGFIR